MERPMLDIGGRARGGGVLFRPGVTGPALPSQLPDLDVPVAVDTESSGLYPDDGATISVVSVAWAPAWDYTLPASQQEVVSVAFPFDQGERDKRGQGTLDLFGDPNLPDQEWEALVEWLLRQRHVWWNAKHDLIIFNTGTRHFAGVDLIEQFLWDGMLVARDLDPAYSAGLKQASERLSVAGGGEMVFRERANKAIGGSRGIPTGRYDLLPWEIIEPYAATDADYTIRHFWLQQQRIDCGEGSWTQIKREFDFMLCLTGVELRGIGYDLEASMEADEVLSGWEREIARGLPFNPSIEHARRWFMQKAPDVMSVSFTDKGKPQLDAQAVRRLVAAGVEHAPEFELLRKIRTARTKWYGPYAEAVGLDGRLRTSFSQATVVSGRLSSERVNLQAIPHDYQLEPLPTRVPTVRSLFRADGKEPGRSGRPKKLWELDLSQAELRVAAQFAQCHSMLDLVRQGVDVHGRVAAQLFDCDPEQPCWHEHRQISKRADFAFIFDVGPETFQADLLRLTGILIEMAEAERIVYTWRAEYPEFRRAIYRDKDLVERTGFIRLVTGRPRFFREYEERHKAFNQRVQGSLAELMKLWMLAVDGQYPGTIVLTIHDSMVLETGYAGVVKAAARIGATLGTQLFGVPMVVDTKEWK
jgi:DNA polymerase I